MSDAGFRTTVLPSASAGAIFHMAWSSGKFHGVIAPTTPIGSRSVISNASGPRRERVAVELIRRFAEVGEASAATGMSIFADSKIGLPLSSVSTRPNSSARESSRSAAV